MDSKPKRGRSRQRATDVARDAAGDEPECGSVEQSDETIGVVQHESAEVDRESGIAQVTDSVGETEDVVVEQICDTSPTQIIEFDIRSFLVQMQTQMAQMQTQMQNQTVQIQAQFQAQTADDNDKIQTQMQTQMQNQTVQIQAQFQAQTADVNDKIQTQIQAQIQENKNQFQMLSNSISQVQTDERDQINNVTEQINLSIRQVEERIDKDVAELKSQTLSKFQHLNDVSDTNTTKIEAIERSTLRLDQTVHQNYENLSDRIATNTSDITRIRQEVSDIAVQS